MEVRQFRSMNTDVVMAAEGRPQNLVEGFARTQQFVLDCERRFTRFSDDSELSQLNRAAGVWFDASPELTSVIFLALHCYELTRGLFDPSILPDLKRAGYTRSMELLRQDGAAPQQPAMQPRSRIPLDQIQLDLSTSRILLPAGMAIDLGGIAKGWIVEQAANLLAEYSDACAVNAGGDMFLVGLPQGELSWAVDLEDPRNPVELLTTLYVGPGALATSSVAKRTWKQGEKQRHHLIDPRTGEPAETDWLSVTVTAPRAYLAEVFAKALLIAGSKEAGQVLGPESQIAYLAVGQQGELVGTQMSLEGSFYGF